MLLFMEPDRGFFHDELKICTQFYSSNIKMGHSYFKRQFFELYQPVYVHTWTHADPQHCEAHIKSTANVRASWDCPRSRPRQSGGEERSKWGNTAEMQSHLQLCHADHLAAWVSITPTGYHLQDKYSWMFLTFILEIHFDKESEIHGKQENKCKQLNS